MFFSHPDDFLIRFFLFFVSIEKHRDDDQDELNCAVARHVWLDRIVCVNHLIDRFFDDTFIFFFVFQVEATRQKVSIHSFATQMSRAIDGRCRSDDAHPKFIEKCSSSSFWRCKRTTTDTIVITYFLSTASFFFVSIYFFSFCAFSFISFGPRNGSYFNALTIDCCDEIVIRWPKENEKRVNRRTNGPFFFIRMCVFLIEIELRLLASLNATDEINVIKFHVCRLVLVFLSFFLLPFVTCISLSPSC